ncbi:UNVERIFIED_CONTAM: slc16a12 [Trichonephila clavipes]
MKRPLIGLLGQKYGVRAVTTVGGFVAALGSILCYFAPNVLWITGFWGIIHGIGFGLSTVIHMMIINHYFDKYKASALGLGYSGDCFGTFAFPVIMEHLLSTYGVKGTFLILGGIVLNVIPMALLLKKPPWIKDEKKKGNFAKNIAQPKANQNKDNDDPMRLSVGYRNEGFLKFDEDLAPYSETDSGCYRNGGTRLNKDDPPIYQDAIHQRCLELRNDISSTGGSFRSRCSDMKQEISSISGSIRSQSRCSGSIRSYRKASEISELIRDGMGRHDSLPPVLEKEALCTDSIRSEHLEDAQSTHDDIENDKNRGVQHSASMKKSRTSSFVGDMAKEIVNRMRTASFASQVAQDGFITSIQQEQNDNFESQPEELSSISCHKVQQYLQNDPEADNRSQYSAYRKELILSASNTKLASDTKDPAISTWTIQIKDTKKPTTIQALIRTNSKPIFILISMSMAVYAFLFVGVLTIIIDYAVDQGVSHDDGKFLIIGFSVADLIGRLSFGQVIDRKLVKIKNYSGITMLLMGTLAAALPLNKSFNFMMVIMCMYGLVQGGTAIMFPILVGHYMDKSEESIAMGCLNFYGGLLMLSMAPMIGYFRDNTGSYNGVFHILGGMVAFVGIIWQLEPLILKFQKKQMLKRANYVIVTRL